MASKKISDFEDLSPLRGTEYFIVESVGVTYKVSITSIYNHIIGSVPDREPATTLTGADVLSIVKGDENFSCTIDQIVDYRRYGKLLDLGNVSGPVNLDLSAADVFVMSLTGDISVGLTDIPDVLPFQFMIRAKQSGSGGCKATWSSLFKHPNGELPVLSTAVGDVDIFIAMCFESGKIEMSKTGPFK